MKRPSVFCATYFCVSWHRLALLLWIAASVAAVAQNAPAPNAPQQAPTQQQAAPNASQQAPPQQQQNAPAPQGNTNPSAKHYPTAKTPEEQQAVQQIASTTDPAQAEKLADDFAVAYPDSELRAVVYTNALQVYFQQNAADKAVEVANKMLTIDPDNTLALTLGSTALAERVRPTDIDRVERLNRAQEMAQRAIDTVDSELPAITPPSLTPDQVEGVKNSMLAICYATLGNVSLQKQDYSTAEWNLRKATQLDGNNQDAVVWYRMSVAFEHENKYVDALAAANKAVELNQGQVSTVLAQQERDRMQKLVAAQPSSGPAQRPTNPAPAQR